jgi:hypothetical protein
MLIFVIFSFASVIPVGTCKKKFQSINTLLTLSHARIIVMAVPDPSLSLLFDPSAISSMKTLSYINTERAPSSIEIAPAFALYFVIIFVL